MPRFHGQPTESFPSSQRAMKDNCWDLGGLEGHRSEVLAALIYTLGLTLSCAGEIDFLDNNAL